LYLFNTNYHWKLVLEIVFNGVEKICKAREILTCRLFSYDILMGRTMFTLKPSLSAPIKKEKKVGINKIACSFFFIFLSIKKIFGANQMTTTVNKIMKMKIFVLKSHSVSVFLLSYLSIFMKWTGTQNPHNLPYFVLN